MVDAGYLSHSVIRLSGWEPGLKSTSEGATRKVPYYRPSKVIHYSPLQFNSLPSQSLKAFRIQSAHIALEEKGVRGKRVIGRKQALIRVVSTQSGWTELPLLKINTAIQKKGKLLTA